MRSIEPQWVPRFSARTRTTGCPTSAPDLKSLPERIQQLIESEVAVISLAVNEESGGSIDPAARPAAEIFPYACRVFAGQNLINETMRIETQKRGILGKMVVSKGVLMFKEQVMHFPKLALSTSRFGCFRRVLRMRMGIGRGKVSKHETHTASKALLNLFNEQVCVAAENAFVISILDERNGRIDRPLHMVSVCQGQGKF